ncbi:MAG: ATP-dependent DNA helicase [Candidatus Omnitrophica bacterium]|jgi:DNA helicase-2/ATP-dependent DNA helicase PcrA|nr:ATP-dependent DNA helicase [Candidatus Omnitrophota bacterium]
METADNLGKYYKKLNKAQAEVVDKTDGPLLVLAGPGTGKTELLSVRAAAIISKKGIKPENILVLTYTNAAAKAMKQRLVKILGRGGYDIEAGTFHSFANSVILESDEAREYTQDRIMISDFENVKLMEYILDNTEGIDPIRPFRSAYMYKKSILEAISEIKKEGISFAEFETIAGQAKADDIYLSDKDLPRILALAKVYKLYEEYKSGKNKAILDERGRYDYDDMILFSTKALRENHALKKALREQYRYIMVDEFQDTNGAQLGLLMELAGEGEPNLCCVGDDDQSIFRFQGASLGNFKLLKEAYPGIETISLKENYRSAEEIIKVSEKLINFLPADERIAAKQLLPNKNYKDKVIEFREFSTESEELLFIVKRVEELKAAIEKSADISAEDKKAPYNNIAVLVRKRSDILKIVDAFLAAGIPYATDGKEDISGEKRVRQMIDIIMLADSSRTEALAEKDTLLFGVLTSDYMQIPLSDVLLVINRVKSMRADRQDPRPRQEITFFREFMDIFDAADIDLGFDDNKEACLGAVKKYSFKNPLALQRAAWAIKRFIRNANSLPAHTALLQYIDDIGLFRFILKSYIDDQVLRIRDLRALGSFVNLVREDDVNRPAAKLSELVDMLNTLKEHGMALQGRLVSMSQNGVRVFTAHGSKGLEFYSVIIPFCVQDKNWPVKHRISLIPLPPEIYKTRERAHDKAKKRELASHDETRLFYVASTRAKSHLIYTASPAEGDISSAYLQLIGIDRDNISQEADEELIIGRSLFVSNKQDPFIGTEDILSDLVSNLTLNPTSLNNYINCKRRFLYNDVLRLPSGKKLSLVFGNCVHKGLEDVYDFFRKKKKFPDYDFFKAAFFKELQYQGPEEAIRLRCAEHVNSLKDWYTKESINPVMPLGLENKLSILLGDDLVFTGKYDKTESIAGTDTLIRVVDYKTGKPDEHVKKLSSGTKDLSSAECEGYLRQLIAYKLLYDNDKSSGAKKVAEGMLVFVEPAKTSNKKHGLKIGEHVRISLKITDDMVSELECVVKDSWKSIKQLCFDKLPEYDKSKEKCGNCDYKHICWPNQPLL